MHGAIMTNNHPDISCHCLQGNDNHCFLQDTPCPADAHPLSESCCHGKVKVCKINGNRKDCARMASLGLLPGTEMELLCPHQEHRQCMIKINGGTLSLDSRTAKNIYVTSA